MSNVPQPTIRFKENLEDFFAHLISITNKHVGKFVSTKSVEALQALMAEYSIDAIMVLFINYTHGAWLKIKERDPIFFREFQNVLRQIPVKEISTSNMLFDIMTLVENDQHVVSREDMDVMWQYCESFVHILIDYVHHTRVPKTRIQPNGNKQAVYAKQFLPHFNIREHCKVWSVDLKF